MSSVVVTSTTSAGRAASGGARPCTPRGTSSAVTPPLIRRRDGAALVLHGDSSEWIVLALRVARPVVGHQDPGERRVIVEDDPEHVEGLALVPVVGGVDRDDRR